MKKRAILTISFAVGSYVVSRLPHARAATGAGAIVSLAFVLAGCGDPSAPRPAPAVRRLRIAAAADLKFAMAEIAGRFEKLHPDTSIAVTYGSSGNFFAQLASEAPFDMFLSADIEYPRRLIEQGQGATETEFEYARGHLVLWTPKDWPLDIDQGFELLRDDAVFKVAIANPKTAPYGRAAVAALKNRGIYGDIESKLVYGENVAQTAQLVDAGGADVGIIALSLAVSPELRDKGKYWPVPGDLHPPIIQGGVVLRWANDARLAGDFRDFLLSAEGLALLKDFGFAPTGE